ncbi:PIN domain-containing protein [soil metagenome]
MSRYVIDASVLLAVMLGESGADEAMPYLKTGVMSAVNLAEVHSRVVKGGFSSENAWEMARSLISEVIEFDQEQARLTGDLILKTKEYGLSLGDRACIALGIVLGEAVCTTDRIWKNLKVGPKVYVIR